mmetsp:Transcript_9018/g.21504  ORF Transcript_9018/g.21504 Transcript_9018/m.21504 type:complete len:205 (-) Transcript_9018:808-1422(-)
MLQPDERRSNRGTPASFMLLQENPASFKVNGAYPAANKAWAVNPAALASTAGVPGRSAASCPLATRARPTSANAGTRTFTDPPDTSDAISDSRRSRVPAMVSRDRTGVSSSVSANRNSSMKNWCSDFGRRENISLQISLHAINPRALRTRWAADRESSSWAWVRCTASNTTAQSSGATAQAQKFVGTSWGSHRLATQTRSTAVQ